MCERRSDPDHPANVTQTGVTLHCTLVYILHAFTCYTLQLTVTSHQLKHDTSCAITVLVSIHSCTIREYINGILKHDTTCAITVLTLNFAWMTGSKIEKWNP